MFWNLLRAPKVHAPVPAVCLHLPKKVDIEEWEPPEPRVMPVDIHVSRLLTMAYDAGVRGKVLSNDVLRLYAECAWMHGMVPISDRQLLCELGCRVAKSRPKVHTLQGLRQLTHYHLPANANSRKLRNSAKSRKSRPRQQRRSNDRRSDAAMAA